MIRNTLTRLMEQKTSQMTFLVLTTGIGLRLLASLWGHNFDVESYKIVAKIVAAGGNVYQETERYNYGPIWFHILHIIDIGSTNLRYGVVYFLTAVDAGIFIYLLRRYSLSIAALFFLNPISIMITGYHSQFDNLAILIALLSVDMYERAAKNSAKYIWLMGIGISLSIKHILFLFPAWLAFKEKGRPLKLMAILIPYSIFFLGFIFYLPDGLDGILRNVFLYKSFNNAPLWVIVTPYFIYHLLPKIALFILALLLLGLYLKNKKPNEMLNFYLIGLVTFSSAIANQYIAIPLAPISVMWNWAYAAYTFIGSIFLLTSNDGLHLKLLNWDGRGAYYGLVLFLAIGLYISIKGQHHFNSLWDRIRAPFIWIKNEVIAQILGK